MEENITEEIILKTGYILFDSIEQYQQVNNAISQAMGFPDSREATERYSSLEPMQDVNDKFVMEISVSVQELYQQTITGYQLVEFVTYKTDTNISFPETNLPFELNNEEIEELNNDQI